MDWHSKQDFEAITKIDVFPASYFDSNDAWYYEATIVDSSEDVNAMQGAMESQDTTLRPANRVKFIKSLTFIRAANVNIDERLAQEKEINNATVLEIPVPVGGWKEFRAIRMGSGTKLREELVFETPDIERPYVTLDFLNTSAIIPTVVFKNNPNGGGGHWVYEVAKKRNC